LGLGSMGVQPAEFAKIGTAILLAKFLSTAKIKQQSRRTVLAANGIILLPMILILLQPDAGTFVVFTAFLFVLYREGISYDPLILPILNAMPIKGLHFKQTWIGTHFIPILFVVIVLSVTTLLFSGSIISLDFIGVEFDGYWGVFFFLFVSLPSYFL
ncbi:MAG: FtsW/RodA/SpoVE family cell cycle protein, partial [Flavobacteriales bacterium]